MVVSEQFQITAKVCKVDESLGIVFGWAIVSSEDGQPYVDLQEDHISDAGMLRAADKFSKGPRSAKEMHDGDSIGTVPFLYPLTADIAKALDLQTRRTGMLIGMRPDKVEVLAKFKSGEYGGFSIAGSGTRRRVQPVP
jgi:hypothetical protein